MQISIVKFHHVAFARLAQWTLYRNVLLMSLACAAPVSGAQEHKSAYKQSILAIQQQIEAGDLDGASAAIASAEKQYPADGGLENLQGVVEVQRGNLVAAHQAFLAAVRHDPRLVGAYLNLSRMDMQSAARDAEARAEALHMSERVVQLDPANDEAHYQIATIRAWEKHYAQSLAELARLSPQARNAIGAQALACQAHASLGQSKATEDSVHALVANADLNEQDAAACITALSSAHRASLAIELLSACADRHPLSPPGLRMLGLAQEADGKLDQARATLEKAFAADSTSVAILIDLTRIARAAGDNQGALGYLAHARDLDPRNASLAYEFGVICLQMGLYAESRKAIGTALEIEPDNPEYNLGMGLVVSYSEDPGQAMPYLQKYHTMRPHDADGVLALGSACFRAKDLDTAAVWLKQAAQDPSTAAEAHYYLGRIARQEGRLDAAIRELNESLKLRPDKPSVLAELGQIAVAQQRYTEASTYLEHALQLDPDNYAANFGLLQLYARTNDPRREQQAKRFEQVKEKRDAQDILMTRSFEIRPDGKSNQPEKQ